MKKWVVLFALSLLASGCVTTTQTSSVCDRIPPGQYSVVCQVAEHLGQPPEKVAAVLKVANLAGLASEAYTAQRARDFIAELRDFVVASKGTSLTYAALVRYATTKYASLPPEVQASMIILQSAAGVQVEGLDGLLLSDYDFQLITGHLDEQMQIILPFLMVR